MNIKDAINKVCTKIIRDDDGHIIVKKGDKITRRIILALEEIGVNEVECQ
jgi:membrane-associated HD superfamily phosphohydrolase